MITRSFFITFFSVFCFDVLMFRCRFKRRDRTNVGSNHQHRTERVFSVVLPAHKHQTTKFYSQPIPTPTHIQAVRKRVRENPARGCFGSSGMGVCGVRMIRTISRTEASEISSCIESEMICLTLRFFLRSLMPTADAGLSVPTHHPNRTERSNKKHTPNHNA